MGRQKRPVSRSMYVTIRNLWRADLMQRPFSLAAICGFGMILLAAPSLPRLALASDFMVSVGGQPFVHSMSPVADSFTDANTSGTARAGSDVGIKLTANADRTNVLTGVTNEIRAFAEGSYDDIVIDGPTPTLETTIHLTYEAVFQDAREEWTGDFAFNSGINEAVDYLVLGSFGLAELHAHIQPADGIIEITDPSAFHQTEFFLDHAQPLVSGPGAGGTFAGVRGEETFGIVGHVDLTAEVPTGQPLILVLDVSGLDIASSAFLASAFGTIDSLHTFGVPKGVPVFDLPPGYTANSPSLGMVDNIVPVPEPTTMVLALFGFAALNGRRLTSASSRQRAARVYHFLCQGLAGRGLGGGG
jgi:hypothetical protein